MSKRRQAAPIPPLGWTTKGLLVRTKDADTVVVMVARLLTLRVLDDWAPETHQTQIAGEKERGLEAKDFLDQLIEENGDEVIVCVPPGDASIVPDIAKSFTLERLLSRVWWPGGEEIAVEVVNAGHAAPTKAELLVMLSRRPPRGSRKARARRGR